MMNLRNFQSPRSRPRGMRGCATCTGRAAAHHPHQLLATHAVLWRRGRCLGGHECRRFQRHRLRVPIRRGCVGRCDRHGDLQQARSCPPLRPPFGANATSSTTIIGAGATRIRIRVGQVLGNVLPDIVAATVAIKQFHAIDMWRLVRQGLASLQSTNARPATAARACGDLTGDASGPR